MRFLRRSLVGAFLFALTLSILGLAAITIKQAVGERQAQEQRQRPARERVFAVNVVPFEPSTIQPVLTSFGEIRSRRTLEIRSKSSGTVIQLSPNFEEGGQVEAGELLFTVDPSDAQSAVDVAMTDVAEAEAEQKEAIAALELASEDVLAAEEQLELRSRVLERTQGLFQRKIVTEDALETAALAQSSARQSVISRKQALAQAEARVDQAQNNLARRKIALKEAERRLADTSIFAEFDGTLSEVAISKGGLVQNNERLAQLVDPTQMEVWFRVSTPEYARLLTEQGQLLEAKVTATLDAIGVDLTANGEISRESAAVGDGQTGRHLFAQLKDAKGFRPGDFVSVQVQEPELGFVVALPASALDAAGSVLVLSEDDRLEVAPVQVLRRQGNDVLVRSRDLRGKEIVAERTPLLGAGIKVKPLRPDQASNVPEEPAMVELTEERRAKLIAFVEANKRMPKAAKKRVLTTLAKPKVPAQMIERLESRMGG